MIIMTIIAAFLVCLAVKVTLAAEVGCPKSLQCPCGKEGKNVTVCVPEGDDVCAQFSRCETCEDGFHFCMTCPEGSEGPFCSRGLNSRQKRQSSRRRYPSRANSQTSAQQSSKLNFRQQRRRIYFQWHPPVNFDGSPAYPWNPAAQHSNFCSSIDSPKLGSVRCVSSNLQQICTGKCLPGYRFDVYETEDEMTLSCHGGVWTPLTSFPDCKSGGHCDLVVQGSGSFNCTTGMDGTRCDIHCYNRYAGRFYCYPGRSWEPTLPRCVRPKEVIEERQSCRCQNGGTCDSSGRCICPARWTGASCETVIPEKRTCRDPGFIPNGLRRNIDGSESSARSSFEEGQSVVYACTSDDYALRGSSILRCREDGTWSRSLPQCTEIIPEKVTCRDPGFISNGFRRNIDGSESWARSSFEEGQSVVFTCLSDDYALRGPSILRCREDGTWSRSLPECTETTTNPVMCPDPGQVSNADRLNSDGTPSVGVQQYRVGQSVVYTCHQGFALQRRSLITCLASGAWSFRTPYCTEVTTTSTTTTEEPNAGMRFCRDPGTILNGSRQPRIPRGRRGFPQGSRLEYFCHLGFELKGERTLFCMTSGEWSANRPSCEEPPQNLDSGDLKYCVSPGDISNGQVAYIPSLDERRPNREDEMDDEYPTGSRLQYTCDVGYNLVGPATLTCETTGSWSTLPPACVPADDGTHDCENPGPIPNGRVRYFQPGNSRRSSPSSGLDYDLLEIPVGSKLEYTCEVGYRLQGSQTRRCQASGFLSGDSPSCTLDCGQSFLYITPKVFRGDPTISGDWPWVVSIAVKDNNGTRFICGGAVINSHTIVTAAHCLVVANKFILRFGKHKFEIKDDDTEVLERKSTQVITHPDYSNATLDSDIGLILFEPRIRYSTRVQPICLPSLETTLRNIVTGRVGYVSGWGDTHLDLPSDELMLAKLPVITNQACLESYRRQNITPTITSNMFCAGYPDARQTVCDGDSGSPFVFYDSIKERFTLEGLVSFGVKGQCGVAGRYAIFTKVFRFLHWIHQTMQEYNVDFKSAH